MATLNQIIYNVANMRKAWSRSDDDSLTNRQYAFIINYYRALLISQFKNKGKYLTSNLVQNLGRVPLIKVDRNDECAVVNCSLRTESAIPRAIDTNSNNLITFVGLLDGTKSYQRTTHQRAIYDKFAEYTGRLTKYYELGNYFYIINPPSNAFKYINIQGIFEDPTIANNFKASCNPTEDCFTGFDYEYPMSITMLEDMYRLMATNELRFGAILEKDTSNNTQDDK